MHGLRLSRTEAEVRDEVLVLTAPFTGEPASLIKLGIRYGGVTWGSDNLALVNEEVSAQRDLLTTVLEANIAVISVEQTKVSVQQNATI